MPFYSKLKRRMKADGGWKDTYDRNLPIAKRVAENIPLVHVTSHVEPGRLSFAELFDQAEPVLPTSADTRFCSDKTRTAEKTLDLGECVYFYAGHALRNFGQVALAFEPGTETAHTGSATPFDTGGLVGCKLDCKLTHAPPEVKRKFLRQSRAGLRCWRKYFGHYLAAYFAQPADYWDGRPAHEDPEELFSPFRGNDPRAWIVEVRFREPQPLSEVAAWCPHSIHWRQIQQRVDGDAPLGSHEGRLQQFLATHHMLRPGGDPRYDWVVQDWAKTRAGL